MNALWIGIVVLVAVALVAQSALGRSGTSSTAAHEKIRQGATVIDVRTPAEYAAGHYEGATNIPLQDLQSRLAGLGDKKTAIVVYCASVRRSAKAAKVLAAGGFTDVTNAGGLGDLKR